MLKVISWNVHHCKVFIKPEFIYFQYEQTSQVSYLGWHIDMCIGKTDILVM